LKANRNKSKTAKPSNEKVPSIPGPASTLSPRRQWAFRIAALLIVPAILVILELALRLCGYGYSTSLFKPIRVGNEDYLVQNDDFSLRFFPKETARNPGTLRMKRHKPPGTYRIFIMGESAAMGDPEPSYGAGRYLESLLREKYPETRFEVVNVAFTAINSHVIVPIAWQCAKEDGDLWIVYMGNNEMVGPFGAATVFGAQAPPLVYVRLFTSIQKTRVGQLLTAMVRKLSGRGARAASWGGMQMFLENRVAPDSPKKEMVYRNFKKNLNDILRTGLAHHAKILLNTVAVNLKDSPPFASMSNTNLSAADRVSFDDVWARARRLEDSGDYAGAGGLYKQAVQFDTNFAEAHFRWGRCLLATSNSPAAREQMQLACDDDGLPFRTDSRINTIIREAARQRTGGDLVLFDAAAALASNNPSGMCGYETFYEHVHFDFDGSYRLGLAWARQIEPMLPRAVIDHAKSPAWASREQCESELGLSDWNRALVIEHMTGRLQVPPFSNQPNIAERIAALRSRVHELHSRMNTNDMVAARENFAKQLERCPDDFLLRGNFALFLQASGDVSGAIAQWRLVHDLIPHDYLPWFQLGRLLGSQAQWPESEADLRLAVKIHPSLSEGWFELGNVLAAQGKFSEALENYAIARRQRPGDAQTIFRMGKVYANMNQHAQAVESYREASKVNAADWEPHYELGGELDAAGKLDEACREFSDAARLNPGYSRAHFNYGVLLGKLGHLDEAQHEFAETVRLEPGYQGARENLAKIELLKRRSGRN
jgi:tetratricopeptide (TPR) repeat protein